VLHAILVDPPIAIIGLSNWALDPAKMNRAICLERPPYSEGECMATAQSIVGAGGGAGLGPWLMALARAYHQVDQQQPATVRIREAKQTKFYMS
jgi:E3 ubiquitin-protein ligase RNF213